MARAITYKFKGQPRQIPFSYDKFHDIYEAVAAAEGIDLTQFLKMEQQVAMTANALNADTITVRWRCWREKPCV